jgi:hypothetical protein
MKLTPRIVLPAIAACSFLIITLSLAVGCFLLFIAVFMSVVVANKHTAMKVNDVAAPAGSLRGWRSVSYRRHFPRYWRRLVVH